MMLIHLVFFDKGLDIVRLLRVVKSAFEQTFLPFLTNDEGGLVD